MAITTYDDLVESITEWLARDGDTTFEGRAGDFITMAEAKFNRNLRVNQMEKRSTTSVNTSNSEPEFISLPSDFQTMRRVRLSSVTGKPCLQFMSGTQADEYRFTISNTPAQPEFFTIMGNEIELIATPDQDYTIEMIYRGNISALSSNTAENWLLTLAPDLYLYGALMEASAYTRNDNRVPLWAAGYKAALDEVNQLGRDQAFNAGPAAIRVSGLTP